VSTDKQLAALMGGKMPSFVSSGAGAELNKEAKAGTGGESINRISMKQSRFRLIVGGEQVKVMDEPYMDVVVVRTNPNVSKAYYSKKYDPNAEDQSPDCYSSNGVVPDDGVNDKQCSTCANCPMNVWGSKISDTGNKVKACSDIKRLAIVPASKVDAPMFQVAIPAGSLKVWGNYVRMLDQTSPAIPYNGVVTRMKFDPDSDYPKLQFEPISWVSDEDYATIKERYASEDAKHVCTISDVPGTSPSVEAPDNSAAEAAAKAEAEAEAEAEAAEKAKAEQAKKAKKAKADAAAKEAAAAWGGAEKPAPDSTPDPGAGGNPEFDAAGWGAPSAKAKPADKKEPPVQHHEEQNAAVSSDDQSLNDVFGEGFDD